MECPSVLGYVLEDARELLQEKGYCVDVKIPSLPITDEELKRRNIKRIVRQRLMSRNKIEIVFYFFLN